jgi:hypothetical protein
VLGIGEERGERRKESSFSTVSFAITSSLFSLYLFHLFHLFSSFGEDSCPQKGIYLLSLSSLLSPLPLPSKLALSYLFLYLFEEGIDCVLVTRGYTGGIAGSQKDNKNQNCVKDNK